MFSEPIRFRAENKLRLNIAWQKKRRETKNQRSLWDKCEKTNGEQFIPTTEIKRNFIRKFQNLERKQINRKNDYHFCGIQKWTPKQIHISTRNFQGVRKEMTLCETKEIDLFCQLKIKK